MAQLTVSKNSALDVEAIEAYFEEAALPLRLAVQGANDFPLVASHWFVYEDGRLYAVLHDKSLVAKCLRADPRCGFEIGSEEPPYRGVRGQGEAELLGADAEPFLLRLFDRYRIQRDSGLARWLLGRLDEERVVEIAPTWVSGWDYRQRMRDARG